MAQKELSNDIDLFADKTPPPEYVLQGLDSKDHLIQGLKWYSKQEEFAYNQSNDKKF